MNIIKYIVNMNFLKYYIIFLILNGGIFLKELIEKVDKVFKKLDEDHINEYSAECAFFTILSFIPFIIFFLSLIQFTNVDRETIYFWIQQVVPTSMFRMIEGIIDEVYSKSVGTVSIAVIFALWSASKSFYYLSKGLRTIYKSQKPNTNILTRIEGAFYTLVFVISIITFLVIMVFGNRIHLLLSTKFASIGKITAYILKIRGIILILGMFVVFLFIYKFIPKNKLKFRDQIYGAGFTAVSWAITSWIFSIYIDLFKGFSNTYGSLTSIVLVMMWVYVCMYIILLGAEINIFIKKYKKDLNKSNIV